ncbi:MAG: hypothetical protein IKR46_00655 [Clostridia bacterium]|nr:hypothetical protein [Clostridia bacterium]
MTNYLIMRNGTLEHYFYKSGIYVKKRPLSGIWQEAEAVLLEGRDSFSVYLAKDGNVHLICTDYGGNLVYAVNSGGTWKKYILSKLGSDISVSDMRLYSVRGRLNLMYSVLYNGENLLVHCILGDRAKPNTVDTIETSHFFIKNGRAYYTNANGTLGYVNLADEKPSVFTPVYDDAHFGTVYNLSGGKEHILFSRNSSVFLDAKELAHDTHLEMPILANIKNKIYIMWKNGSFVRYIASDDGENFGKPMRFMTSNRPVSLFAVQKVGEFINYYGYDSPRGVALLGNPDIFENSAKTAAPSELENIKNMLNKTQQDLSETKKELARLNRIIGALSGRD